MGMVLGKSVLHMHSRPHSADYQMMARDGGIKLHVANISLSESSRYYPFRPQWNESMDIQQYLDDLDMAVRKAPEATFLLGLKISYPEDFVMKHPDEAWLDRQGRKAYGELPPRLQRRAEAWISLLAKSVLRNGAAGRRWDVPRGQRCLHEPPLLPQWQIQDSSASKSHGPARRLQPQSHRLRHGFH